MRTAYISLTWEIQVKKVKEEMYYPFPKLSPPCLLAPSLSYDLRNPESSQEPQKKYKFIP